MSTVKELLIKQTAEAFKGRPDMSLMASLGGILPEEASWSPDPLVPNIEHLVRHIAWSKSRYCHKGFDRPMVLIDRWVNEDGDSSDVPFEFPCGSAWGAASAKGIAEAIALLQKAHASLSGCLESCTEAMLDLPIPTTHGKSAANFFWTMLMHDTYHAGQIRTRRTMYRVRKIDGGTAPTNSVIL